MSRLAALSIKSADSNEIFRDNKNIWTIDELRNRIGITLLLVLVYRLGCYVVLPGISPADLDALSNFTNKSGLMQLLDMFSGGAFSQASIFALGIMPISRLRS